MRVAIVLGVAGAVLALAGCAEQPGGGSAEQPTATTPRSDAADGGAELADDNLLIEIDRGDGTEPETYTLSCLGEPSGDHPDPRAACVQLEGLEEPFAPLPEDQICTEQYGGPQTARILGTWDGEDVDLRLDRTDGCAISQWDSLGPLLPGPVGVEPVG